MNRSVVHAANNSKEIIKKPQGKNTVFGKAPGALLFPPPTQFNKPCQSESHSKHKGFIPQQDRYSYLL